MLLNNSHVSNGIIVSIIYENSPDFFSYKMQEVGEGACNAGAQVQAHIIDDSVSGDKGAYSTDYNANFSYTQLLMVILII